MAGAETASLNTTRLQLNLMVDKVKMRLVYAECDRFMADSLFSFLTTPVGALARRTGKNSGVGCIDNLYRSVEDMDSYHFQTPACKDLLLRPRSAFGFSHHRLKLSVNDVPEYYYGCPSGKCVTSSLLAGGQCECGFELTVPVNFFAPFTRTSDEVFVSKEVKSFVVTDDLFMAPSSDALKNHLCRLTGVEHDSVCLQQQTVIVDSDRMVELMKMSLQSDTPLTDTFLSLDFATKPIHWPVDFLQQHLIKAENSLFRTIKEIGKNLSKMIAPKWGSRKMAITIFHDEDSVLFAIVEKDFADLLFSFLTFPFGSIVAALGRSSSLRCMHNLHQLVNRFQSDGLFFKHEFEPDRLAKYLLEPPIALHHNCENHLLIIGKQPYTLYKTRCSSCIITGLKQDCENKDHTTFVLETINPKYKGETRTKKGGGYMRWPETFVITNSLVVEPILDPAEYQVPAYLQESKVLVGQKEALKLLLASIIFQDPLTSVFLPSNKKK